MSSEESTDADTEEEKRANAKSSIRSSSGGVKRKRSTQFKQNYRQVWETKREFAPWLTKSRKGTHFYYCKVCDKNGRAGLTEITNHNSSTKHRQKIQLSKQLTPIQKLLKKSPLDQEKK